MTLTEKLEMVQFIVDPHGERQAAIVDLSTWEELLNLVRSLEAGDEGHFTETAKVEKFPVASRERLLTQVRESREAYEAGEVRRGTVDDFMAEIDD